MRQCWESSKVPWCQSTNHWIFKGKAPMLGREATTPLAIALGRVAGYRGLKPPTTESSKGMHPCWGGKIAGEENEVFNKHSAWGTTHNNHSAWGTTPTTKQDKEDTTKPGIWTNVLPVGNHATLGRALRNFWVSFHHCECSLCLKQQFWKFYLFKTMTFYQLKHAKHLLNWNK